MPPTPAAPAPAAPVTDPIVKLAAAAKLRANQLSLLYAILGGDDLFATLTAARSRARELEELAEPDGRWN